jgi:glycosyltransferase involved in cell wall biosynthesis
MKISIITVCFNSEATIEHTLKSVLSQDHTDIEYIIVDGGSTDGTGKIIKNYADRISVFVSEKDEGIYFALNKGIQLATGEIIGILHSDDFFSSISVLSLINTTFERTGADAVYGDLQYVFKDDVEKVYRNWISGPYKEGLFLKGWMPPHPSFFVKHTCYQRFGLFNTRFRSAADYELMLRFIQKNHIRVTYIPQVLVKMRVGGKSNVSLKNRLRANMEDRLAWKVNGIRPGWFTLTLKPLSKLRQFLGSR